MIRERARAVMPFDLDQTLHRFVTLPEGGIQTVTVNDPANRTQMGLVQQHMASLAEQLRSGDFSDPSRLHGSEMPGLQRLAAAAKAGRLDVAYASLPHGVELRYTSADAETLAALQEWFSAQLADHGHDAAGH